MPADTRLFLPARAAAPPSTFRLALKRPGGAPAEIKPMWVAPSARGLGAGVRTVRPETNRVLAEAIALYRAAGYREVAPFTDEHYADHWFEKILPGPRTLAWCGPGPPSPGLRRTRRCRGRPASTS
ncbi:hypothetical protein AB0F52_24480 [Amycolatopsis sp. NPDC024027]|uniref:hypothetical protein n=1 Tax=Amycolatopsis sp. NPDC024027 TaxID=3154327 RepID=UPI0033E5F891